MLDCNLVKNPIVPSIKLLKTYQGVEVDSTLFKQLVESLVYLTATRSDITHFVILISCFMEHPKDKYFLAAKHIYKELKIWEFPRSDYAGDLDNRNNTYGYAFMLGGGLRRILEHLDYCKKGATIMFCDNASIIKLSKNPVLHGRSKHIDVRFYFLRDLCNNGVIQLNYCNTREQVVDIMTKPLKVENFHCLQSALGMLEEPKINCCKEHSV
ncbi:hypothetical protein CR513_44655, partial [Mucuna pruriens]